MDTRKSELKNKLIAEFGDSKGSELFSKYANVFPSNYFEDVTPELMLEDIKKIEILSADQRVDINFYFEKDRLHLRMFQYGQLIPLSDVLPMLENLDLRTLEEHPYKINLATPIFVSDFEVVYGRETSINFEDIENTFQETFLYMITGRVENDGFNKLVLGAQLNWRQVSILRTYAKYLKQVGFRFSQSYIENALAMNSGIARKLVNYFEEKFNPELKSRNLDSIENEILQDLEKVSSLDEDRMIRRIFEIMKATLRTNYFQLTESNTVKPYLSVKLSSKQIPEMPLPIPLYEIFIYSPRFEGIHLRTAKVARGGIRWSDRREDFRTEILGLMKAQKVKNAVIVPSGAKGGFVLKTLPLHATREDIQNEVVTCYKLFIRGLLDITDNIVKDKVTHPRNVVLYDEDDPYLVVAADKGTATFSDIANELSAEYQFWLGDAFASGGSAGYDHKKMGITARGAWESVKRHFTEINLDMNTTDFTVVGIGDMSGDVFGNGLIYSPHIKLLAAFDHRHIFLDPNPNPKTSFAERERMFHLPTSSWADYNPALISEGGGVFKRTEKSITLSPQVRTALAIEEEKLAPNDLIRAILKAPVDLLWNGGIGTYVKASSESQADVGDKTNEYCRINGDELRCKAVGEGGNLGFTQLGRIEYALKGGLINTDFIDNSAGVDCSDHEVNIKITLNQEVAKGKLTLADRNKLLANMTQEVADLVLKDNYNQALVMSIANYFTTYLFNLQIKYIKDLEAHGVIKRSVEYLPDEKKLIERKSAGLGLTSPELAVLLAYTKIYVSEEILKSDIPEDPYLNKILYTAFPATLKEKYATQLANHPLHREIVATQLSNMLVNEVGTVFLYNLQIETSASVSDILRATVAAITIFETSELQKTIQSLSFKLPFKTLYDLIGYVRRLVYLSARWFLRHKKLTKDNMPKLIEHFAKSVNSLRDLIPTLMGGSTKSYLTQLTDQFKAAGISQEIAYRIASTRALYTSLNIIEVGTHCKLDLISTAKMYFAVGEDFNLLWFRDRLATDAREGFWEGLSRLTLRDELDSIQRRLTVVIMNKANKNDDPHQSIQLWLENNKDIIKPWNKMLEMLHSSTTTDYVMFFIALKELSKIINLTSEECAA